MKYKTELSKRQQQVYDLIRLGLPTREIAVRLGIRQGTVSRHKDELMLKKGVFVSRELQADISVDKLPDGLSVCQELVLRGIVQGKTSKEIAADMNVATRTVTTHTRALYKKLDVHSRHQATEIVLGINEAQPALLEVA